MPLPTLIACRVDPELAEGLEAEYRRSLRRRNMPECELDRSTVYRELLRAGLAARAAQETENARLS